MSRHAKKSTIFENKWFKKLKFQLPSIDFSQYHPREIFTLKLNWKKLDPRSWDWISGLQIAVIVLSSLLLSYHFLSQEILREFSQHDQASDIRLFSTILYVLSVIVLAIYLHVGTIWKTSVKLTSGYFLYLATSYFILVTRNLNNEGFKPENFGKNHFWQLDTLPTLLTIVILAVGIKIIVKKFNMTKRYNVSILEKISPSWALAAVLTPVLAKERLFTSFVFGRVQNLINDGKLMETLSVANGLLAVNFALLFIAFYAFFNTLSDVKVNRASISLVVTTSLILSVIFNYTLQLGVKGDIDLIGYYIFPGATAFQIAFLFVVYLMIYLLLNRYLLSTFLIIALGSAISIVNVLKQDMRSEPLLVTDFVWLQEPSLLISVISRSALTYTIIASLLFIALYFLTRKRIFVGKLIILKRVRLTILLALVIFSSSVFTVFKNETDGKIATGIPVVSTLNNQDDVTWLGFTTNARYKSLMYVWTKQIAKTIMDRPEDYNQNQIAAVARKYEERARVINEQRKDNLSDQTVIFVLSESLANPNRLSNVTLSSPALPLISQIQSETTSGLMTSNGYGGGTANMEFQSLTGLPLVNYSPNVSILYSEVAPKMSVFPSISDQFDAENRFVIHPAGANNYNRKNIYNRLGFGHMIFTENTSEKISNPERVGLSISDETVYRNILEKIDTSKSQFFSTLTMQNHAPWSVDYPVEVTATGRNFSEQENKNFTEYARLLTYTDGATKDFLDSLKNINKKITVVFYGDHLPGFYPISSFKEEPEKQYQTDYFIWSNYQTKKLDYPIVGSSDFIAELLEHTASKVTPYQALLTDVLETKKSSSLTKEQEQTLEDLKLVQYDISVGNGYLRNDKQFFSAN